MLTQAGSNSVCTKDNPEFLILLPPLPNCRDDRCVPPDPVTGFRLGDLDYLVLKACFLSGSWSQGLSLD